MNAWDTNEKGYDALAASFSIVMCIMGLYSLVCVCMEFVQGYLSGEARTQTAGRNIQGAQVSQRARQNYNPGTEIEMKAVEQQSEEHSNSHKLL